MSAEVPTWELVSFHALGLDFEIVIDRDGEVDEFELTPAAHPEQPKGDV